MSKIRQTALTRFARGKPCTLRVAGYGKCDSPDTSVFCHAPAAPIHKGKSLKSHDSWGAIACHTCHALIDDRAKLVLPVIDLSPGPEQRFHQRYLAPGEKDAAWLRGIHETQHLMLEEGLLEAHL